MSTLFSFYLTREMNKYFLIAQCLGCTIAIKTQDYANLNKHIECVFCRNAQNVMLVKKNLMHMNKNYKNQTIDAITTICYRTRKIKNSSNEE